MRRTFLIAAMTLISASAFADTLELRNGRIVNGKYVGGTQGTVRFESAGEISVYRVDEIIALTFGGTVPAVAPAPAPAAAPARKPMRRGGSPHLEVAEPAPAQASRDFTVPAGTRLIVRMVDGVDSTRNQVGDRFQASLEEDLLVDGTLVVARGTDVYGRLVQAKEAGRVQGRSILTLELTEIRLNGTLHTLISGDYEVKGDSRGADTAKKVGGGAALGAIIGAVAGGGKGAAIGAAVGGAAGGAVQVMTRGEQVKVPSETVLEFRLEEPVVLRNFEPARPAR